MINQELEALYKSNQKGINSLQKKDKNLDSLLLLKVWEEEYNASNKKILFIGKETNGWLGHYVIEVESLLDKYDEFELCKNGRKTTIWQQMYRFNKLVNRAANSNKNFAWTNVSKSPDINGTKLSHERFSALINDFNVLAQEIKILNPDVVIFLCGHAYDSRIRMQFEGNIEFEEVEAEIPVKQLAKLKHPSLPKHTYRTYHPGYLSRSKKLGYLDKIADRVLTD